jgi:haloalkane dehalogenase
MGHVLEALDLRDATMVVHDWGGPVGLRAAVAAPERIARLVILDTGLFTGEQRMTDAWKVFREFVERTEDLPISMLVNGGTARELTEVEMAAYDAPFPSPAAKAGTRAFPLMMPRSPEDPGAAAGREVVEALARDERPALVLWATEDPIIPLATGRRFAERLGLPEPEPVEGAGHFLQEDAGARIGARIAAWLGEQRA